MYRQIVDQITAKVVVGDWPPGFALPSIRELSSSSKVSVITVKRAYLELERDGVIVTVQGKGSFVSDSKDLPRALMRSELTQKIADLLASAEKLGVGPDELKRMIEEALSSNDDTK